MNKIRLIIFSLLVLSTTTKAQTKHIDINENLSIQSGEVLTYSMSYSLFFMDIDVGEVKFYVRDTIFNGIEAFHLKAVGKSYSFFDHFFKVRDTYETWVSKKNLRPIYFNRDVNEGGYIIDIQHAYNWNDSIAYVNTRKTNKGPYKDTISLKAHTHNILSVFYYSRNAGYNKLTEQDSIPIRFLMDSKIEDLSYCYKGKEERKIGRMGKFNSLRFTSPLIKGTMFKDGDEVEFWVSDDKNLLPLWVESPIIVGSVRAKLVQVENLKHDFSSQIY